jgi:hypothetical protein
VGWAFSALVGGFDARVVSVGPPCGTVRYRAVFYCALYCFARLSVIVSYGIRAESLLRTVLEQSRPRT